MTTSKLNVSELDLDAIVQAFSNYLQSQTEFSDYNYEGAGMRVLMRLLAYNTHYLSYYLHVVANEMYMDSADKRESVVSIAKELGYTPRSAKSATAIVNLTITPPTTPEPPATITIEKSTIFNSSIDGKNYTFLVEKPVTVSYDAENKNYVARVTLKEGKRLTHRYVVDNSPTQKFIIPNANADTSSLVVNVQKSAQDTTTTAFTSANDINQLNGTSTVYFLQEIDGGKYEVYFGDGILGKELELDNIVSLEYIVTNGSKPNYCNVFTPASKVGGYSNVTVATVNAAYGGDEPEDIESIRFSAPKHYGIQNRAVTAKDYKLLLQRDYPNIDSVSVWGGEDENPAQYGKVFISLKPVAGYTITETAKLDIINNILKKYNVVSVIPEIKDPDYIFVKVDTKAYYTPEQTTRTSEEIKALILAAIKNYRNLSINKFDATLRYSKLVRTIDDSEVSVTNNFTTLTIEKFITPTLDATEKYTIDFANAIKPGTISSESFIYTMDSSYVTGDKYYLDDDSNGVIRIYKIVSSVKKIINASAGTVNYTTGKINLINFRPHDVTASDKKLGILATPVSYDVVPSKNNIVTVKDADISVTMYTNA
jgi:hypothetical protein